MWARVIELTLGCWLAISPFVFGHPADGIVYWAADFSAAMLVISFSLLSYWNPTRHAHLLTVLVALGMIGYGRFTEAAPLPPALQNHVGVGLLLVLFAVIPNHAERPPAFISSASSDSPSGCPS